MLMYGKVSQENFVELTASPTIPNSKADAENIKNNVYAPAERGTADRKGGRESFLSGWLICVHYCAIFLQINIVLLDNRMSWGHYNAEKTRSPEWGK